MPQMFGSIRTCCAASTELEDFPEEGIQWGDREYIPLHSRASTASHSFTLHTDPFIVGEGDKFRHAGFSASKVGPIVPGELYCGRQSQKLD